MMCSAQPIKIIKKIKYYSLLSHVCERSLFTNHLHNKEKEMKRHILSLLLVLCASLSTLAQRVTAEFTNTPLSEALLELERQCPDMRINFVRDDMKDFLYGYAHVIDDEPRPVVPRPG